MEFAFTLYLVPIIGTIVFKLFKELTFFFFNSPKSAVRELCGSSGNSELGDVFLGERKFLWDSLLVIVERTWDIIVPRFPFV